MVVAFDSLVSFLVYMYDTCSTDYINIIYIMIEHVKYIYAYY